MTETRFPRDILSKTMNARSQIANLEKDLKMASELAEHLEGRAPYTRLTRSILTESVASGQGRSDFSYLFPFFEDLVDQLEKPHEP